MITAYDAKNDGFCIPFNRSGLKFIGISSSEKERKNRFNLSIHSRVNTSTFFISSSSQSCQYRKNVYGEIDDGFQEVS